MQLGWELLRVHMALTFPRLLTISKKAFQVVEFCNKSSILIATLGSGVG